MNDNCNILNILNKKYKLENELNYKDTKEFKQLLIERDNIKNTEELLKIKELEEQSKDNIDETNDDISNEELMKFLDEEINGGKYLIKKRTNKKKKYKKSLKRKTKKNKTKRKQNKTKRKKLINK